jgi:tetratricopeptide (TPR) repeat protein
MQQGDVVADQFELERIAGRGGMGEVWRARDRLRDAPVALKLLTGTTESGRARFLRESVVLSELRHPGIVRYVAHGVTPSEELYLAMEWLDGEDLSKRLEHGPLTIDDTVALLKAVAEALSVAHARGIVHRDIKPGNVFLPRGVVDDAKILDFGVARVSDVTRTRAGGMVGTPGYMAPEQARGEHDTDARADIFALGCVAFECLTGRRAFEADHVMALLAKILLDEVPRVSDLLPEVPSALDELVRRMVSKDRENRPRDAAELLPVLEGIDAPRSMLREPMVSLTRSEQRMLGVVLVPPANFPGEPLPDDAALASLRDVVRDRGGKLENLADGSVLAVLSRKGVASDLAVQAARCALAMRRALPGRAMSLATGRGQIGTSLASEAIDRAAKLLVDDAGAPRPSNASVFVDEVTAGLLGAKFDVVETDERLELHGELELDEEPRTLLGKATSCVGRDREIASLEAIFRECRDEPVARAVLVTAPAGAGKSRLRNELVARLRSHTTEADGGAVEIWTGRGDPMRAGSPFGLAGQMLRRACAISEGEPLETRQSKLRERVASRVAEADRARVTEFLGELIGAAFPDQGSVQLRAARQDPMLMSDQVRGAWQDFIAAECRKGPVVLVIEDLHWGDLPTVKLVDAALRSLPDRPLMVLALARPEVHELFPKLWEERELQEIRLGGLTKKAAERLVRQVLGPDVSNELVTKIIARADGNAFYLEELIRAVAEGRGEELPETMVAMVESRLEKLDPEARRILRAGSVFGQTFWKGSAEALLGGPARVGEWLEELMQQELISKQAQGRFPSEEEFAFRHALLRDGAYAMLTEDDRRLGHLLAGDWLERKEERDAMMLAEHFERGAAKDRALRWYPRATEQALEGNDLEGALTRADRGIACGATGGELGLLRSYQAEARNWRGENAEAVRLATEAMDLLPKGEAAWYAAAREAIITAHKVGNPDKVIEIVTAVSHEAAEGAAFAAKRMALGWGALTLLWAGRYAQTEQILDELANSSEAASDPRVEAVINKAKASWALYRGSPEAPQWIEASVHGFEQSGDLRNASMTRTDFGFFLTEFGAYEEAERLIRQSLIEAERMNLFSSVPQVKHNLGLALMGLGRLADAAQMEIEAAEALHAQGQRRVEGLAETYLAMILLRQRDLAGAEAAARKAVALLDVVPNSRAMALAVLARTLLVANRDEALGYAREAMDLLRSLGALEEGEALVRLAFADALHAKEDPAAQDVIREARDVLLRRADRIREPHHRKSFLEAVEENRETLARAAAWLKQATGASA